MVSFLEGKPDKNFYRKFKIKIQGKPNDVAMIKEVIGRRLNHKEWPYPDLMLVDGGISQFNAARSVIKNKKILIAAISKAENKLFIKKGRMIFLKTLSRKIFNLILQLRDEAHRFAITYHKKLRQIKTFN
jgi:excinuclease ABC subunit C